MDELKRRLSNLLTVKSLVTLTLTGVFAALSAKGQVTTEHFLTIFMVVVGFYFGTQKVSEGGK